jgi:hypothetical protein
VDTDILMFLIGSILKIKKAENKQKQEKDQLKLSQKV